MKSKLLLVGLGWSGAFALSLIPALLLSACLLPTACTSQAQVPPPAAVPDAHAKVPLTAKGHSLGWHRSETPSAHPRYSIPPRIIATPIPALVDLRPACPPVYDQGQLGSCTANALGGLHQYLQIKEGKLPSFVPSRLMIYWGERAAEGTIDTDAGADGDDGVSFLVRKGVCPESLWPYDISKFAVEPSGVCWGKAAMHRMSGAVTINGSAIELKTWLATEKIPIAFGFTCYPGLESDETASTGILPMPQPGEQPIGGHEVLLVGYDDSKQAFIARNSWGPDWGLSGYFYFPYAYATNSALASDFRSATHVN